MSRLPSILLWLVLLLCCGLPMAWLVLQLVAHPGILIEAVPDAFRWRLIARTFALNAGAATLSVIVALPLAAAMGLGALRWMWLILPVPLLMPSLVVTYAWKQMYAWFGADPLPQSAADVARCVLALASWLWPVPTMIGAFAIRRIDPNVLLHARLDGVVLRTVLRLAAGPLLLGWLVAMLLGLQEFAVFEPTGISVIATEVRAVFETGASLDQRWSLPQAGTTQPERMAAALAVMLPSLLATTAIAIIVWRTARSLTHGEWHEADQAQRVVRAPLALRGLAVGVAVAIVALPIAAMIATLRTSFDAARIIDAYAPQLVGSFVLAALAASVGAAVAIVGSIVGVSRAGMLLALASFLVGGQWAAIALIVIFNQSWLLAIYDSAALPVIAYVGRFAWIVLAAAAMTWSPATRPLRDLAAVDGAGRWATWRWVILPLVWPLLAGAVLLLFTLSLTEVPATTLLQPAQTLVPMLMTWAHILNYDAMIETSLLLTLIVMTSSVGAAALLRHSPLPRTRGRGQGEG